MEGNVEMVNIIFIADYYAPGVNGGAEKCDFVLISELREKGYVLIAFESQAINKEHIKR